MSNITTRKPAVLSEAGAHSEWIARPFLEAGLELDKCWLQEVPERLATGQYNVLVLGRLYMMRKTKQQEARAYEALTEAITQLLAAGGGVLLTYPLRRRRALPRGVPSLGRGFPRLPHRRPRDRRL